MNSTSDLIHDSVRAFEGLGSSAGGLSDFFALWHRSLLKRLKRVGSLPIYQTFPDHLTVNKQFPSMYLKRKSDASRRGVSLDHVERLLDRTTLLNMPDPRN